MLTADSAIIGSPEQEPDLHQPLGIAAKLEIWLMQEGVWSSETGVFCDARRFIPYETLSQMSSQQSFEARWLIYLALAVGFMSLGLLAGNFRLSGAALLLMAMGAGWLYHRSQYTILLVEAGEACLRVRFDGAYGEKAKDFLSEMRKRRINHLRQTYRHLPLFDPNAELAKATWLHENEVLNHAELAAAQARARRR